jgi:hypothetical protein
MPYPTSSFLRPVGTILLPHLFLECVSVRLQEHVPSTFRSHPIKICIHMYIYVYNNISILSILAALNNRKVRQNQISSRSFYVPSLPGRGALPDLRLRPRRPVPVLALVLVHMYSTRVPAQYSVLYRSSTSARTRYQVCYRSMFPVWAAVGRVFSDLALWSNIQGWEKPLLFFKPKVVVAKITEKPPEKPL